MTPFVRNELHKTQLTGYKVFFVWMSRPIQTHVNLPHKAGLTI